MKTPDRHNYKILDISCYKTCYFSRVMFSELTCEHQGYVIDSLGVCDKYLKYEGKTCLI